MRKIEIKKWKQKVPKQDEEGKIVGTEMVDWSVSNVLGILINNKKPEEMPRGIDKHRMFNRIVKAFDKAEETKFLELEEADYKFLKETIEKDIPASWGGDENINEAVEAFVNAKQEE